MVHTGLIHAANSVLEKKFETNDPRHGPDIGVHCEVAHTVRRLQEREQWANISNPVPDTTAQPKQAEETTRYLSTHRQNGAGADSDKMVQELTMTKWCRS